MWARCEISLLLCRKGQEANMLFLYDIQSPINIGMILRVGEQFQIPVAIYDKRNIMKDENKVKWISDFSCGAINRTQPEYTESFNAFQQKHRGRIIATCFNKTTVPLQNFKFKEDDIILFGNEYDGLPKDLIENADAGLYIPLPPGFFPKPRSFSPIDPSRDAAVSQNGVPNLNVSMSTAIIRYVYRTQYPLV